jgi:hypothetical protein
MPGKGRPFPKGISGNPGGRPKVLGDVQELARQKSPEAITTLANIMQDEKAPPAARVAAANALLDRGYGKPTQPISQTLSKVDPSSISDEEFTHLLVLRAVRHRCHCCGMVGELRLAPTRPERRDR